MGRQSNVLLHEAIERAGWTYDSVAQAVRAVAAEAGDVLRTNRSAVSHWMAGVQPSTATARYLTEALSRRLRQSLRPEDLGLSSPEGQTEPAALGLSIESDPVDVITRLGRADIERRTFLTTAAYSVAALIPLSEGTECATRVAAARRGGVVGDTELAAVREMTTMLTAIDERHGGQHGRSAVVQYLTTDVADLCRATWRTTEQRRDMLSAAASVTYLAGWKAHDAGEHGLAQRYYLQCYSLTREAENDQHVAWVLRILAHHGMDVRRPEHTLDIADAALGRVKGRVDAASESLFVATRGRALSVAGRPTEAVAEMGHANEIAAGADDRAMPYWAALWGPARATVASHTAKVSERVGDHAEAERLYSQAAAGRAGRQFQRIKALNTASAGRMQCAQGHVDRACDTWARALDTMTGVRSARTRDAVISMRRDLAALRRRGIRSASQLDERAALWLRQSD